MALSSSQHHVAAAAYLGEWKLTVRCRPAKSQHNVPSEVDCVGLGVHKAAQSDTQRGVSRAGYTRTPGHECGITCAPKLSESSAASSSAEAPLRRETALLGNRRQRARLTTWKTAQAGLTHGELPSNQWSIAPFRPCFPP